jgi:hypothetical protein
MSKKYLFKICRFFILSIILLVVSCQVSKETSRVPAQSSSSSINFKCKDILPTETVRAITGDNDLEFEAASGKVIMNVIVCMYSNKVATLDTKSIRSVSVPIFAGNKGQDVQKAFDVHKEFAQGHDIKLGSAAYQGRLPENKNSPLISEATAFGMITSNRKYFVYPSVQSLDTSTKPWTRNKEEEIRINLELLKVVDAALNKY